MVRFHRLLAIAGLTLTVATGCATPDRIAAVPDELYLDAVVPGMADVRYFTDERIEAFVIDGIESVRREMAHLEAAGHDGPLPPANLLAISGGGDNGAFGAGLLVGWTESGTRPEFKIVTGVSTGSLIAPFAFLGPDYDDVLREVYTTITPDDVYRTLPIYQILVSDGAADSTPLWNLIAKYADADLLAAIARESRKGRVLLVATTNLDAQRSVIWNIGKIAESGHPEALRLFHSILIASASVPGGFPPVMIDVEAGGRRYQEMHVDGGTVAQVFIYPPSLDLEAVAEQQGVVRERRLYVIRNARLDPEWSSVERYIFDIVGRAIQTLIQSQGIGDLYEIYLIAQRDGLDYNLAFIPPTFDFEHTEEFGTAYMNALFDLAYTAAVDGYRWQKLPPGFESAD
ncbi:MAG: patatin-like phospholipase family protein [Alphaproteobacteria bacterium]|nr:patatin-like phospholipase family protein [Alphaproteobacteria bacterium]